MSNVSRSLAALGAVVSTATLANATPSNLVLDIYGSANIPTSIFKFSGSTTYSGTGAFLRTNSASIDEFKGTSSSDFVNGSVTGFYNNFVTQILSGNARVGVGGNWYDIDYVHLDHDSSGDDFGISIVNGSDVAINNGDVLQFAGKGVFNAFVGKLNVGTYTFSDLNSTGTAGLTVNVYSVPEPGEWAAMGILGAGLAGLVVRSRRRSA
jgi:hypothetical protein